jgi:hypothetical protein
VEFRKKLEPVAQQLKNKKVNWNGVKNQHENEIETEIQFLRFHISRNILYVTRDFHPVLE